MRLPFQKLFSDENDPKKPLQLGLGVALLFALGVLGLWWTSRTSRTSETPARSIPPEKTDWITTAGTFAPGARLFHVLRSIPLSPQQSQNIVDSFSKLLDPRSLNASDRYEVLHSTSGQFHRFSVVRKLERFVVEAASLPVAWPAGTPPPLAVRKEALPLTRLKKNASATLSDSLWTTLRGQGLEASVIVELADIFAWNIDFLTETRAGDRLALSWEEERTPEGRLARVNLIAAVYSGKATGRQTAVRFEREYYDENGGSLRRAFLHAPLNYRRISSGFTNRRFHPILRQWRPHHGTDYAAPTGTPVVAVGEGTVFFRGNQGGLGNVVKIRHNGTYSTYYGHLSRFAQGVVAGTHVRQGQVVGFVGSTGLSTGPHLHFEVIKNGTTVNFLTLKIPPMKAVPANQKQAFAQQRDQVLPPLENQL